jgi:tripartite-type tricarboxylate transporter receptor subunit TctC
VKRNLRFDVQRDLKLVGLVSYTPHVLVVRASLAVNTLAELIALAKAQPGKLSYASPGVGTPQHIAGELLKRQAGIDIIHVPYRGAVFTDVIGGRVTMTLQNMGSILPVVRQGQLRGLAVTSLRRTPIMPDLPTLAESGLPGFEAISWFGLMAPAGTPKPIIGKVYQQAAKIAMDPEMKAKLAQLGLDAVSDPPAALAAIIKADIAKWAKVIKDANIKAAD